MKLFFGFCSGAVMFALAMAFIWFLTGDDADALQVGIGQIAGILGLVMAIWTGKQI